MKRSLASYAVLIIIITFLIYLNLVNYRDFKRLNAKCNFISSEKQREIDKSKHIEIDKNLGAKRSYGYSDILSLSSSTNGMSIMSIENSEGEKASTKVSLKYKGNSSGLLDILSYLQKQENLIRVTNIKITYNKEEESILGNINTVFINNK